MVTEAIDKSEGKGSATKDASPATKPGKAKKGYSKARQSTVGGSIGNLHDGYAANESTTCRVC